jgi:hypothetical protein
MTPKLRKLDLLAYITVLTWAVVCTLLTGCDGFTHIHGIVKNAQGVPVPNVEIQLSVDKRTRETVSSADGQFDIGMVHAPSNVHLKLLLKKDGYQTYTRDFRARNRPTAPITIMLQEITEPTLTEIRKFRLKGMSLKDAKELAELMCRQLPNIAAFPMKSYLSGDDVHDTLVLLSGVAQQCLVDHITESAWVPDARSEPKADFRAGDSALWILFDAGMDWDGVIAPLIDPKKFESIGVYEYFDWVNKGNHRKIVQRAARNWLQKHPQCCGSEADFSATADASPSNTERVYKIDPQRFSKLKLALAKLKPGMDEKQVRQLLGPPDAEADLRKMMGMIDLTDYEKTAAFYLVETHTAPGEKFDIARRNPLRDRYVVVFFGGNDKFIRAFSNVSELPYIFPASNKLWTSMFEKSLTKIQEHQH